MGAHNEGLFELIQGSFLFVGGNFRGSGDLITTPLHTFLPGVYYHAMAFENLAMFDGRPKVREEFRSFKIGIFLYDLWCCGRLPPFSSGATVPTAVVRP